MNAQSNLFSWRHAATVAVVYCTSLVLYRLFLHPLARFPGPTLAAITRWYEAYYDIVQNGQYTFKIVEMHKKYGPIVRISPYELHVIDPAFFEKLYRQDGRWDKYAWCYDGFSTRGATVCTADHDIHRARRLPLSPFFSKAKVTARQELIRRNVDKFCSRISTFIGASVDLGAATSALTRDISTEFAQGKTYNNLDEKDFNAGMTGVPQTSGYIWRITKHVTWFGPTMKSIPIDWVMRFADEGTRSFFRYLKDCTQDTQSLLKIATSSSHDNKAQPQRTIVHEILDSHLPPIEKAFPRVFDEVVTVTGAGFETTASVLRLAFFHVFSNPGIVKRLRAEITSAAPGSSNSVELRTLERLPYLTSVLMEGLRLSPGIGSRMARISDKDLFYHSWRIPAGTPVGMTTILMHTDVTLYPDPMRFDPDRWMDLEARKKVEKTYAPFSRGTRICLGMHLAWAEMYLILAALVQRFDFRFDDITAADFEMESDQFFIGTRGKSVLKAQVTSSRDIVLQ